MKQGINNHTMYLPYEVFNVEHSPVVAAVDLYKMLVGEILMLTDVLVGNAACKNKCDSHAI